MLRKRNVGKKRNKRSSSESLLILGITSGGKNHSLAITRKEWKSILKRSKKLKIW